MAPPGNGIFVVRGEISVLMTAMKRGNRWNTSAIFQEDGQNSLMKSFIDLKHILNKIEDLRLIDPSVFLLPFLDVIRSEETSGPITSLALSAVNKFLTYGLIDPTHSTLAATVDNIADAVTHARFLGADAISDGVVLIKIIQLLRTLIMNPEGSVLTNESVCEIMLSCFRLGFEPRLNDLIRKTAEHALRDMVLLLFIRLPQFSEDSYHFHIKKLKMRASEIEATCKTKKYKNEENISVKPTNYLHKQKTESDNSEKEVLTLISPKSKSIPLASTPVAGGTNIVDMQGIITQTPSILTSNEDVSNEITNIEYPEGDADSNKTLINQEVEETDLERNSVSDTENDEQTLSCSEYVNSVGVRFTQPNNYTDKLLPYGLPCIRELFRFLISLCNPLDKQNTDIMMHIGLSLLTVALEVGGDSIGNYDSLLCLVKDELCRNLFSLLNTERLTIFASDLQVCFLIFESLRSHLKFQLEYYLGLLSDIIGSDSQKLSYEARELALDNMLQFWQIPGFTAELFINFDCNLYCTNLFENLTKLLSRTTLLSYNTQLIYSTQVIAMDALLTVIDSIEKNHITTKKGSKQIYMRHSRQNSNSGEMVIQNINSDESVFENINNIIHPKKTAVEGSEIKSQFSKQILLELKNKKHTITQGTELFNNRAEKGIQYLMENGILKTPLDPLEIAQFLRENPGLDKKMIGEYISKKKNVESRVLESFVKSFDFSNMTIDKAMRIYLETFRLPGEAPLIFLVVEHFADHWHKCNNEPFANTDAAFKIAYSIIMLNMDQHNHNAKRLNVPMNVDDYLKNLRGLNGNGDFDQEMLTNVFNAIKNDEIIMPAEQSGIVKENYLWKVLLRRGLGNDGRFYHVFDSTFDKEIFEIVWGSLLTALSYIFDKSNESSLLTKSKIGFKTCASISSNFFLQENFDAVILTLCKFSTLLNVSHDVNEITAAVMFGQNFKSQEALKCVFKLIHEHGNCMKDGWKNILDVILTLFRLKLLPESLLEVEDFCEPSGKVILAHEKIQLPKTETSIFSSLYSYLSNDSQRIPTFEEQEILKKAKQVILDCQIDQMILEESKFLKFESLHEMIKSFLPMLNPPEAHKSIEMYIYPEEQTVFLMELLVKILIQNKDRVLNLWHDCKDTIYSLLMGGANFGFEYLLNRTTVAILKLAICLMRNEELCPKVLQSLHMFLMLKPSIIFRISKQISTGMFELLKTSAQNIHTESDWKIIFTILECVGAGAIPPEYFREHANGTKSDGALSSEDDSSFPDRGYTSDSELTKTPVLTHSGENWILVNKENDKVLYRSSSPINPLAYPCKLLNHSPIALVKCWDCLAFIVRNVAHITPYNFESCVKCIRTFVEASLNGGHRQTKSTIGKANKKKKDIQKSYKFQASGEKSSDSENEEYSERYQTISIQLLDLMHTLHIRTAQIFRWWAEEGGSLPQCSALWEQGWRPILQSISRLATDKRQQVRRNAITCLQRSLLVHDLQALTGPEWWSCFKKVLFPLLSELLNETSNNIDTSLIEESRMRTAAIMSKVFLHHLTPLITLPNFNELWLEILDFLERFMKVGSDLLYEAVLESLKNMLLVMHSVHVFRSTDGHTHSELWELTWNHISEFLPDLKDELFKTEEELQGKYFSLHPSQLNTQNRVITPSTKNFANRDVSSNQQIQNISVNLPQRPEPLRSEYVINVSSNIQQSAQEPIMTKSSIILQQDSLLCQTINLQPVLLTQSSQNLAINLTPQSSNIYNNSAKDTSHFPETITPDSTKHSNEEEYTTPVPIYFGQPITDNLNSNTESSSQNLTSVLIQQNSIASGDDIYTDSGASVDNFSPKEMLTNKGTNLADETNVCVSNVFQSVNYFGSNSGSIPPGSEMLFDGK